jgi:hypothetical protein
MRVVEVQTCVSAHPWFEMSIPSKTEAGKSYRVLVPWPDDGVEDLTCECQGFIFRGRCHHQDEAFEQLCRWSSETGPEEQTKEQAKSRTCPRCGGPTTRDLFYE